MDIKRAQEVFGEDDDSITRDDDSIPLADENPSDVLEESLISDDKRKVTQMFVLRAPRNVQLSMSCTDHENHEHYNEISRAYTNFAFI